MNENLQKGDSVFFIELDKIDANPYQPRVAFDEDKLNALADSIKQYGVLQPIVVTRKEEYSEEFGIRTRYQIIAGERRFRAAKIAGLNQIPAIIRSGEHTDSEKLELAIIENLQREDLNPVDKAKAFKKLADDFGLTHAEIAKKMGKSREYVSNAMRILMLPENILTGLTTGKISEGHTRSLLMLKDRPEEQAELYKRIVEDKLTVRAAERIARSVATDKIRKKIDLDPEIKSIESHIREKLGTKVTIDQKPIGEGGKLTIEYFSKEDLKKILAVIESNNKITTNIPINDNLIEENISSETDFDNIQPTVFKEEIDKIEQFGNVEPQKNDLTQSTEKMAQDLVDNWGVENSRNENLNQNQIGEIDGLKKIEIKNDFDKSRIDSFKKTEDILKSFGATENSNIVTELKDTNNDLSQKNIKQKEEGGKSAIPGYSNLYDEFLKAKSERIKINSEQKNKAEDEVNFKYQNNSAEAGEVKFKINSAGNIEVKKNQEEDVNNLIMETNRSPLNKDEDIKGEVLSGQLNDFLADAKIKNTTEENELESNQKNNSDENNPDDLYNFKGFSL